MSDSRDPKIEPPRIDEPVARTTDGEIDGSTGPTQEYVASGEHAGQLPHGIGLPEAIGRYLVKRYIGRGGFGAVYEGWDESLHRAVAIKVLTGSLPRTRIQSWLREGRTLASLDHPGIVPVYDVGEDPDGRPYIVSKLIPGGSLADQLHGRRWDHRAAAELVAGVARALDFAHRKKVVHRDVKPANILLAENDSPVLADFGLAMHESEFGTGGRFVGTPSYMSPEQARREGHRVDGRTDIYSLGAVLYELLTATRPFQAVDVQELLECVRHIEVRPPRQIDRDIPRELERICLKALAKRASDRYPVASDMADDLEAWLRQSAAVSAAPTGGMGSTAAPESPSAGDSAGVSIVPRGLRAFNAADADFFLHLLPGPRDRDGLPESVRFWKTQIEGDETRQRFRVGAILGPSGSGKSSLVRAGILPHLDADVEAVILEARPDGLESLLHKRVRRDFPQLDATLTLTDALQLYRRHFAERSVRKRLLLVIDQFEQWLSVHANNDSHPFLESLRQCDGNAIQALVLVRDDFTLALAAFMDRLEEPLLQNHNFAVVDFFSLTHAKKVLTAFGRAYGCVDQEPTREQSRFLELAIAELEASGHVVPVHLALFADMVKEQPWSPATLRQFGGARGVGVAFLEDRLTGRNANPEFRSHAAVVRRLLAMLLPTDDSDVRPPARSRFELVSALSGMEREETVDRLLRLLDSELRLVTPSAATDGGSVHSDSSSGQDPAVQLTHDYLVPSIRQWLESEQRQTRRGRAAIRLRELAQGWSAKPDPRRLPSWLEWLSIQCWTRHHDWSAVERRMMQAATRRAVMSLLISAVLLIAGWGIVSSQMTRWRADVYSQQLVNADLSEVAGLLLRPELQSESVARSLANVTRTLNLPAEGASVEENRQANRRRLNVALAMARRDPLLGKELIPLLPSVAITDLGHLAAAWPTDAPRAQDALWRQFDTEIEHRSEQALSCAAILAHVAHSDPRWRDRLPAVVDQLADVRPVQLSTWIARFQPLSTGLVPVLSSALQDRGRFTPLQRANLIEAFVAFGGGSSRMAKLLATSSSEEFQSLLPTIDTAGAELRADLRREFQGVERILLRQSVAVDPRPVPPECLRLQQQIAATGGFLDALCGLTYALTPAEFTNLAEEMRVAGYCPTCIRVYSARQQQFVSAAWQKSTRGFRIDWDIDRGAISDRCQSATDAGFVLDDFDDYAPDEGMPDDRRLVCLWITPGSKQEVRQFFDVPQHEFDKLEDDRKRQGVFTVHRYVERVDSRGNRSYSVIWRAAPADDVDTITYHRFRRYFGDHEPGLCLADLRMDRFDTRVPDRMNLEDEWQFYESQLKSLTAQKNIDLNRMYAAKRLSAMGRYAEARRFLEDVKPRVVDRIEQLLEILATLYARMGLAEELRAILDQYQELEKARPTAVQYFQLRLAILANDAVRVASHLGNIRASRDDFQDGSDYYLLSLAVVAARPELAELATNAMVELREELRTFTGRELIDKDTFVLQEVEFDPVRGDPEVSEILDRQGFGHLMTAVYISDPHRRTRLTIGLNAEEHSKVADNLRRDGYLPVLFAANPRRNGQELELASIWEQIPIPETKQLQLSRSLAQLGMALARLNESDLFLEGLLGRWGSDVQSRLILESPAVVPPTILVNHLRSANDDDLLRTLVLTCGACDRTRMSDSDRDYLHARVTELASSARDAAVRQAACWALSQWEQPNAEPSDKAEPSDSARGADRHLSWFLNGLGQTMIVLHPPKAVRVGAPMWETGRKEREHSQFWIQLDRKFALAATETTIAQFAEYLNDPDVAPLYKDRPFTYPRYVARHPDSPQISVSWLDAVRFCEWLNEKKERLPESEWCYPGVLDPVSKDITFPANYLERTGYRLPTEIEWEYAARADVAESRHCGNDPDWLTGFEWTNQNANGFARRVASLRPNPFGFFDTLGNAVEWTENVRDRRWNTSSISHIRVAPARLKELPAGNDFVTACGGRYTYSADSARAAERNFNTIAYRSATTSVRVARTVK